LIIVSLYFLVVFLKEKTKLITVKERREEEGRVAWLQEKKFFFEKKNGQKPEKKKQQSYFFFSSFISKPDKKDPTNLLPHTKNLLLTFYFLFLNLFEKKTLIYFIATH